MRLKSVAPQTHRLVINTHERGVRYAGPAARHRPHMVDVVGGEDVRIARAERQVDRRAPGGGGRAPPPPAEAHVDGACRVRPLHLRGRAVRSVGRRYANHLAY